MEVVRQMSIAQREDLRRDNHHPLPHPVLSFARAGRGQIYMEVKKHGAAKLATAISKTKG